MRLMDLLSLERIQFLSLLIGPTNFCVLCSCQTRLEYEFFIFFFLRRFLINFWSTGRHLVMCSSLLTARPDLKSLEHNLCRELGLSNKLDNLCCWVIFRLIITLLLPLTIKYDSSCVEQIYRAKGLHEELQLSLDDGLLTYSVLMKSVLSPKFTVRFCARIRCFQSSTTMDDEREHFRTEPISLSKFFCFSNILIVRLIVSFLHLSSLKYSTVFLLLLFGFSRQIFLLKFDAVILTVTFWQLKNTYEFYIIAKLTTVQQ
jgi:hypothetical protein